MSASAADVMQRFLSVSTKKLLKRYAKANACDKERAGAVLTAYKKFLALKVVTADYEDEALAPPPLIHAMWREHVLDTAAYQNACEAICGRIVHHLPQDEADDEARHIRRCHRTLAAFRKHFNAPPPSGGEWDFGALRALTREEEEDLLREAPAAKRARSSTSITVSVRAPYQPFRSLQVRTDQTVQQLFHTFVEASGAAHLRAGRTASPPTVHLRCGNAWLHDLQLLADAGVKEGSAVFVAAPAERTSSDQLAVTIRDAAANASAVVYARPSDTVEALARLAQDVLGVPQDAVQLIFRGEVLTPADELGACRIDDGSTVQMVVGRRRAAEATMSPGGTWR